MEAELDEEIRVLQAGDERRNSCASQSNGCCFDSVIVESSSLRWEQRMQGRRSKPYKMSSTERFDRLHQAPATPVHTSGGEGNKVEEEQEQEHRAASRKMGPPAPGVRNEGFPVGSVLLLLGIRREKY